MITKYPVSLSIDEVDTILDALADYATEFEAEWDGIDDEEFTDLRMKLAIARRELFNRQRSK